MCTIFGFHSNILAITGRKQVFRAFLLAVWYIECSITNGRGHYASKIH